MNYELRIMNYELRKVILITLVFIIHYSLFIIPINAQSVINIKATPINLRAALTLSPPQQTLLANSTFDVSVFLDTRGNSINTVELNVRFSADKLTIIKPSGDKSLISVWLEPPSYSNDNGTARLVGLIPNGITTKNGLIATITFKAKATGSATVTISPTSKALANDGLGTEMNVDFGRAVFTIVPVPPEGITVFSATHLFQDIWYNNKNPILAWEINEDLTDFSYELDNKPLTIPDNISDTKEGIKNYEDLKDGIWYFHIKVRRDGVWGQTTHFALRIDTTPPARFRPTVEFLTAEIISKALVSFFTTDELSGINHYEVGVVNKTSSPLISPAFVQAESPYQLTKFLSGTLRVIVRAFDKAGNVRDESIDVDLPLLSISPFIKNNLIAISLAIILIFFFGLIIHYFLGHHLLTKSRQIWGIIRELFRVMEE